VYVVGECVLVRGVVFLFGVESTVGDGECVDVSMAKCASTWGVVLVGALGGLSVGVRDWDSGAK